MRLLPLALLSALSLCAADSHYLLRNPTVSKTHVVFEYADDLWIVNRAGGEASRLTSGAGIESEARFSPDGSMVAFTGNYDGNTDVFVVPAAGGIPKRLTFHPGPDLSRGWTPDGKRVLFVNSGTTHNGAVRLYTVDLDGGFPQELKPLDQLAGYLGTARQFELVACA